MSDLAEVVDCFASLLAEDTDSEQHQVAEAFVEGLEAAAALQVGWDCALAASPAAAAVRQSAAGET